MINKVCRAVRRVWLLPRGAVAYLLILGSYRYRVDGFEIVDASDERSPDAHEQIRRALRLIAEALPTAHARLRRDVRRVILLQSGGPEYWPFANAIALAHGAVKDGDTSLVAMALLHEGTHARLWRAGIGYPQAERGRIERLCISAELRLARRLSNRLELEKFAQAKLSTEWWTDEAQARRTQRVLRELGWPSWLLRGGDKRAPKRDDLESRSDGTNA